jgi:hypothetical protein
MNCLLQHWTLFAGSCDLSRGTSTRTAQSCLLAEKSASLQLSATYSETAKTHPDPHPNKTTLNRFAPAICMRVWVCALRHNASKCHHDGAAGTAIRRTGDDFQPNYVNPLEEQRGRRWKDGAFLHERHWSLTICGVTIH